MKFNKKTRSDGGTSGRETVNDFTCREAINLSQDIIKAAKQQAAISSYLMQGARNAIPARKLCEYMGYQDTRALRLAVERERATGTLILSSMSGYYLPSVDPAEARLELQDYIRRTDARMISNRISVRAAKAALKDYTDNELAGQEALF